MEIERLAAQPMTAVAYTPMFVLFPLIVVVMLLVAGLVAGVAMLSNERTRFAGGVILGLLGFLVVGGGGLLMAGLFYARTEVHREAQWNAGARSYTESVNIAPTPLPAVPIEVVTVPDAGPAEKPTGPAEKEEPAADDAETAPPKSEAKPPVAPQTTKSPRPGWVDHKPPTNGPSYMMVAVVGPYTSRLECDAQLPAVAQRAVDDFVAAYLGSEWAGRVQLSHEYILSQLVKDKWEEPVQASFGPMVQVHVLLDFDHRVKEHLKAQRDHSIVMRRLGVLGTGVGAALLVLCIAFVVLKLDLVSGGQRRGRLAVVAVLSLVAVVVAAGFLIEAFYHPPLAAAAPRALQPSPTVDGPAVSYGGPPLTPAEALAPRATWGGLAVLTVLTTVGLIAVGAIMTASGRRSGRIVILLGAALVAAIVAVLVAAA